METRCAGLGCAADEPGVNNQEARTKVCDVLMMERFLNSFAAFFVWAL